MVGTKKGKLATRFVSQLAKELVSDSGFSLSVNTQALKDALRKSVDSLPSGKLRSTLQLILERENEQESFISALQIEIRVLSVKLELHGDVLLTPTASQHLFETLLKCIDVKEASCFTDSSENHWFIHDEIQVLLARDPPPHILWALAAMKLTYAEGASCTSASTLLQCLKPWIVDRNASVAMATLAPLVPLIYESLQQAGRDISKLKILRNVVKEVLSFTVAVNYKEHFTKGFAESHSRDAFAFSALLDGFWAVVKPLGAVTLTETDSTDSIATKLNRMFPLASELTPSLLKPPDVQIGLLADLVKSEVLLIYMVVEVLYCREKSKGGDKVVKNDPGILKEQVGRIAVYGLAAGQTDLILDILLSDLSSLNCLLDAEEKSLVCVSLFKGLLLSCHPFMENNAETQSRSKNGLEAFVKKIAVARKYASKQRTKFDIVEGVACYLRAPPKLVDYLKSGKMQRFLSQKGNLSSRALIGWLVQLDDSDFQALVKGTQKFSPQAGDVRIGKGDLVNTNDAVSMKEANNHAEIEDLFFVDTTGEEQAQDNPAGVRQGKKSKKRKAKQVLFHRQGRVTKVEEDKDLNEGLSDSSDSRGSQSNVRGKRRNGGENVSPSHGTEDG